MPLGGAANEVEPKFLSPSDPAAQWTSAVRGPACFPYADNHLIDLQSAVIVDVEASRVVRQTEVGQPEPCRNAPPSGSASSLSGSRVTALMARPRCCTG